MLIAWMIYAVAITAIVAGCALALDRVAEIWGASRRVIWLAALMIAVLVPLGLAVRPVQVAPVAATSLDGSQDTVRVTVHALPTTGRVSETEITRELLLTRFARPRLFPAFWNRFTGLAWLVTSIVLSGLLFRGAIWLWRGQTRWHRSIVDGHSVLLTNDVGPAVVGVVRPRILLPAWALALNAHERGLMLEHEAQHVRARGC